MSVENSVILQNCGNYAESTLLGAIDVAGECIDIKEKISGKKILIKPNLISARGTGLACTHPLFIKALALWCKEQGAKVCIGDSPAFGNGKAALENLGILDDLLKMGVEVLDFSRKQVVKLQCGVDVGIAAEAIDCDLFVNAPKVKAHNQMYVTLGLKNIFGIVKGVRKSLLHMSHGKTHERFAEILIDLLDFLPANATFVDGIQVMHKSGPITGFPLSLNCIAAGKNPVALDTAFMQILELDELKSPLLMETKRRGIRGSNLEDLDFPILCPSAFQGSGFSAPENLSPVRFNPLQFFRGQMKRMVIQMRGQ